MISDFKLKFSYWILIWFVLFMMGFISYNPFFAFIIALLLNLYALFVLCYKGYAYKASLYLMVMLLIKVVPIILLICYDEISVEYRDVQALIFFGFIYLVYIEFFEKKSLSNIYNETNDSKIRTPLMVILDRILK